MWTSIVQGLYIYFFEQAKMRFKLPLMIHLAQDVQKRIITK